MISTILPYMRCPGCSASALQQTASSLDCSSCGARYALEKGIPNMLGDEANEVITPFQRLMQTPLIVSIYEKAWRRAGYYLASSRSFGAEMETVLRMAKSVAPARSLDLACGPGVFTRPLARVVQGPVVGLDLSRPMLVQAQQLAAKERISNIVFVRGTAFSLPFADGAFPYVNCCGALHLFDNPKTALREISRVLEPGGHLCVQTTIRPERSAGFAYFLERFIRFGFFDETDLREELRRGGFDIIDSERHRISFTFLARYGR